MGVPIQVTSVPQKVSGTATRPYLLVCDPTSSSTVFIGQNSSVSTSNYSLKLTPGSSITWTDINNEIWAVTDIAGSASITAAYEASGTFTPALVGSAPTLIKTLSIPFTQANSALTGTMTDVPVSVYNSLIMMVSVTMTTAYGNAAAGIQTSASGTDFPVLLTAAGANNFLAFSGVQYDAIYAGQSGNFTRNIGGTFSFGDGLCSAVGLSPAIQTLQFPVTNQLFSGTFYVAKSNVTTGSTALSSGAGTVTFRLYGSQQSISSNQYKNWPVPNPIPTGNSVTSNPALGNLYTGTNISATGVNGRGNFAGNTGAILTQTFNPSTPTTWDVSYFTFATATTLTKTTLTTAITSGTVTTNTPAQPMMWQATMTGNLNVQFT